QVRHLLGHEVAAGQGPASRLHSFLFPEINGIAESRRTIPSFGPQRQNRTSDFLVPIGLVDFQVDPGTGAIVLAGRVNGGWIAEAAQIFRKGFRGDGSRGPLKPTVQIELDTV